MAAQAPLTAVPPLPAWEAAWAPYDEPTYTAVLNTIAPDDVVLDIGAGDLRLARRMAAVARRVIAIEQDATLTAGPIPPNLTLVHGDARTLPFPPDVTKAVLLMRHCTHLRLYWDKLTADSPHCTTLLTNARWGFGVEQIALRAAPRPWSTIDLGWFACRCGHTGFVPGAPERLTAVVETTVHEVADCPACRAAHMQ